MCGLRSGIIFFYCSFSLFLLCLAPDAFAVVSTTTAGRTLNFTLNQQGMWSMDNAPATVGPGTLSDGPSFYYFTNPNSTPSIDSSGNVVDHFPAPALPIPDAPVITDSTLVKAGDIAAAAAPFLAQAAGLTPQGRAAITGLSVLWSLWQSYYHSSNSSSSLPSHDYYCGSTAMTAPSGQDWIPAGIYCFNGAAAPCGGTNGCFGNPDPYSCSANNVAPSSNAPSCSNGATASAAPSGSSSPSTAKIPAPTAAQLNAMFNKAKADALTFLKNLPHSVLKGIPMSQSASGPSSFTGQPTSSSSSSNSGNVTKVSTPTFHLTYSGPTVGVSGNNGVKTTTCTATGTCTVVQSSSPMNMAKVSPFVPPTANYPKVSTSVPTNSVPFTSFSFGAPWLPKTCPSAPTFQVCAIGGVDCQTETLPTYVICQLASGIEPVVTTGGGLLGVLILAW